MKKLKMTIGVFAGIIALFGSMYVVEDRWNQGPGLNIVRTAVADVASAVQSLGKRTDYNFTRDKLDRIRVQLLDLWDRWGDQCAEAPIGTKRRCIELGLRETDLERKLQGLGAR